MITSIKRKLTLVLCALLVSTFAFAQDVTFSTSSIDAAPGEIVSVSFDITNSDVVGAFNIKITLPDQLSFYYDGDPDDMEDELFQLTDRKPKKPSLNVSIKSEQVATIVYYDTKGASGQGVKAGEGAVLEFQVKVAEDAAEGEYAISFSDYSASDLTGTVKYECAHVDGAVKIALSEPPAPTTYTVNCTAGENGTVTITPEAEGNVYEENTEVTLTAIPNDQCKFVEWSDGNTENPRVITVTEDITLSATFEIIDGINGVSASKSTDVVYDLKGARVKATDLPKGTYIINGKKVVIK